MYLPAFSCLAFLLTIFHNEGLHVWSHRGPIMSANRWQIQPLFRWCYSDKCWELHVPLTTGWNNNSQIVLNQSFNSRIILFVELYECHVTPDIVRNCFLLKHDSCWKCDLSSSVNDRQVLYIHHLKKIFVINKRMAEASSFRKQTSPQLFR